MKATGVIIARFQTPYLHDGHKYLLDEIRSKHNKVIVVLGVSPVKGSRRNPMMQQGTIAKEHHVLVNLLMKNLNA